MNKEPTTGAPAEAARGRGDVLRGPLLRVGSSAQHALRPRTSTAGCDKDCSASLACCRKRPASFSNLLASSSAASACARAASSCAMMATSYCSRRSRSISFLRFSCSSLCFCFAVRISFSSSATSFVPSILARSFAPPQAASFAAAHHFFSCVYFYTSFYFLLCWAACTRVSRARTAHALGHSRWATY